MNKYKFKYLMLFVGFYLSFATYCESKIEKKLKKMPRTYEFFPGIFPQPSVKLLKDFSLRDYYRNYTMMSEVSTVGSFDIMPLSGASFWYYCMHQLISRGYSLAQSKYYFHHALTKRKQSESHDLIVFVLANLVEGGSPGLDVKSCPWKITMKLNERYYKPKKIEAIKRDPSLEILLDYKFDRLKKIYKLTFTVPRSVIIKQPVYKLSFKYLDNFGEVTLCNLVP